MVRSSFGRSGAVLILLVCWSSLKTQPMRPVEPRIKVDRHGDLLPEGALARLGTTRLRHGNGVLELAFSPTDRLLASVGRDGMVRVWDIPSGRQRYLLEGHGLETYAVAFDSTGKVLASSGSDGTVRIWDVATGKERQRLPGARGFIHSLAFQPGNSALIFGSSHGLLRMDLKANQAAPHGDLVFGKRADESTSVAAHSPDGEYLAVRSNTNELRLCDPVSGKVIRQLTQSWPNSSGNWGQAIAFAPDGKILAAPGEKQLEIQLWNVAAGTRKQELPVERAWETALAFSPKGDLLLAGCVDGRVLGWDTTTWKEVFALSPGHGQCTCVGVSADGKYLAGGANDGTIHLWELKAGKAPALVNSPHGFILCLALMPDGKTAVTGSDDGTVSLWDLRTGEEVRRFSLPLWVRALSVNSRGDRLLVACQDGKVRMLDPASGKDLAAWPEDQLEKDAGRWPVLFLDDTAWASVRPQGAINIHASRDGKILRTLKGLAPEATALAVSGQRLAVASGEGTGNQVNIRLRDWTKDHEHGTVAYAAPFVTALTFSPQGDLLASMSYLEPTIRLFDGQTCRQLRQFPVEEASRHGALAFTPDGKRLLTGGVDYKVRAWDVATGKPLTRWSGHQGLITTILAAPDGRTALSASWDGTVLVWDLTR